MLPFSTKQDDPLDAMSLMTPSDSHIFMCIGVLTCCKRSCVTIWEYSVFPHPKTWPFSYNIQLLIANK